jgi:hypothetical protein
MKLPSGGKLKKFIAEPFDVRTATHVIDGNTVVLVYVAPM